MTLDGAAGQPDEQVLRQELQIAELRGEDRIRQRVLGIGADKHHSVTIAGIVVDVIETDAVADAVASTGASG